MMTVQTREFGNIDDLKRFVNRNPVKIEGVSFMPTFVKKNGDVKGKWVLIFKNLEVDALYGMV